MMGSPPTPPSPPARASTPSLDRPGESPQRAHGASVAWLLAALVMVVRRRDRPAHQALGRSLDRPRRRTQGPARRPARVHTQSRRRLRLSARQPRGGDDPDRRRAAATARVLRAALHARADLAAHRHARSAARSATSSTALRHGSVTDFIKLPLGWPPFNLADASITLGVVLLFVLVDRARTSDLVSDEQHAPFTIAFQDEHLLVVDKAPGVVVHPARGHREDTLSQLLAPLLDGDDGRDEARRGIVHRLDRDTSGLLVVARSDGGASAPAGGARATADRARIPGAGGGTPAGTHGHDRGADRARPARAHAHGRRRRRGARGPHALHARARAPGQLAAAPAPRDRAHPPDPRAHAGDRTPGVRRPRVRHRRAASGSSASSCTRRGSRSSTPSPASRWTSARPCRRTCRARCRAAERLS